MVASCFSGLDDYIVTRPLVRMARRTTNKPEPMIDQMMGNDLPATLMEKSCGSPSEPASQVPITAPTKPTSVEVIHPPIE